MRPVAFVLLLLPIAILVPDAPGIRADAAEVTRWHHPWGRFQPGAWKSVCVTTETFEAGGTLVSTTETLSTLQAVDSDGVTLRVEVGVQIAGKWFETQPATVKQDFFGELAGHRVQVTELAPAEVTIGGRQIPCHVFRLESENETTRTVSRIFFSETVEPYVLRREATKTDLGTGKVISQTTAEVVETDVPCRVLGVLRRCAQVKWEHEHPGGRSITVAFTCADVPGGVVCQTLKEYDKTGQLVRRSHLELLGYGFQPEPQRRGLFGRKRAVRGRRAYRVRGR